jgi:hypothetical protein
LSPSTGPSSNLVTGLSAVFFFQMGIVFMTGRIHYYSIRNPIKKTLFHCFQDSQQ